MRCPAVLEHVDSLPRPERQTTTDHRDRQARLGQRGTQMRGHVVRTFVVMLIFARFRRDPGEITLEIAPRGGRGVLLDQQRCGGVPDEYRQQTRLDAGAIDPAANRVGTVMETLTASLDRQFGGLLPHDAGLPQTPGQG